MNSVGFVCVYETIITKDKEGLNLRESYEDMGGVGEKKRGEMMSM